MPRFERKIEGTPDRKARNPFTGQNQVLPGRPSKHQIWECEAEGRVLRVAGGDAGKPLAIKRRELADEDAVEREMRRLMLRKVRSGFRSVGESQILSNGDEPLPSALMLEAFFEAGDDRFVSELVRFREAAKLAAYAPRWMADPRPWARRALLEYIDDGCTRPGHKALVKRLFKAAETAQDDQLMGHFLVAFDRSIVKVFGTRKRPALRATAFRKARPASIEILTDPLTVGSLAQDESGKYETSTRFSRVTRRYLMRRAWRYFRKLGHRDPTRYGVAIRGALVLYEDASLRSPLRILAAWGLLHALYASSPVLDWSPSGIRVVPGRSMSELEVSPRFPDAWRGAFGELVPMLATARSRLVRRAVLGILRKEYETELAALDVSRLRILLESPSEEAQELGVERLKTASGGEHLSIADWLKLLQIPSIHVVSAVCDAMKVFARPDTLSLEEVVALALSKVAPIADLALGWAEARIRRSTSIDEPTIQELLRLRNAEVASARRSGLDLITKTLAREGSPARMEHARDLVDAKFADAREVGLELVVSTPRYRSDPRLLLALAESPWPDVRAFAIREAQSWLSRKENEATLGRLWATIILSVHSGSRAKITALRQIADTLARDPSRASELVPLLTIALSSVRGPERIGGLAGLARAAAKSDAARAALTAALPELRLGELVSQ